MTKHRCPTCRTLHSPPKAWKVLRVIVFAIAFGVVEALAALTLDGWLSWALWAIAAWNTLLLVTLVVGLSVLAAEGESSR